MHGYLALVLALGLLLPAAGRADEQQVTSRVTEVTVQLDRALVVREAEPALDAGRQTLVFGDLPVTLDRSTVRLESEQPSLAIGRPTFREVETTGPVTPTARRITETLDRLRRQRRIERDAIAVQELILEVLGRSQLTVAPDEIADVADTGSLFDLLETRSKEALRAIRSAEHASDQLDAEIDRLERELARLGDDPMRRLELSLPVEAETAGPASLRLAYAAAGAGFAPILEARLDVERGRIELVAMAEVSQRTGEDWAGVDLALSTARPSRQTAAPPTGTRYIDIRRDEPRPTARREAATPMVAMADTALDTSSFDVVYRLAEPQTIAADGSGHQVRITTEILPAELVWRSVPAVDATAYLTAAFTYAGTTPLLPGPVVLYRDGQPIGRTRRQGLQPGEALELGFGADPAIAVERHLLTDRRARSGLVGSTRRHERRYAIEVTNHRTGPVDLEIIDNLPVARDDRITVELAPDTTTPMTTEHDGDPGVLAWQLDLGPGEAETITFAYTIRHPADLEVTGF